VGRTVLFIAALRAERWGDVPAVTAAGGNFFFFFFFFSRKSRFFRTRKRGGGRPKIAATVYVFGNTSRGHLTGEKEKRDGKVSSVAWWVHARYDKNDAKTKFGY